MRIRHLPYFLILGLLASCASPTNTPPEPESQTASISIQEAQDVNQSNESESQSLTYFQGWPLMNPASVESCQQPFDLVAVSYLDHDKMQFSFVYDGEVPPGRYIAEVLPVTGPPNLTYECLSFKERPTRLYCYGESLPSLSEVTVSLRALGGFQGIWGINGTAMWGGNSASNPSPVAIWGSNGTALWGSGPDIPEPPTALAFDFSLAEGVAAAAGWDSFEPDPVSGYQAILACSQALVELGSLPEACAGTEHLLTPQSDCGDLLNCADSCASALGQPQAFSEGTLIDLYDRVRALAKPLDPTCGDFWTGMARIITPPPAGFDQAIDMYQYVLQMTIDETAGFSNMQFASLSAEGLGLNDEIMACAAGLEVNVTTIQGQQAFFDLIMNAIDNGLILSAKCTSETFWQGYFDWMEEQGQVGSGIQACAMAVEWDGDLSNFEGWEAFSNYLESIALNKSNSKYPDYEQYCAPESSEEMSRWHHRMGRRDRIQACLSAINEHWGGDPNLRNSTDLDHWGDFYRFWKRYALLDEIGASDERMQLIKDACTGLETDYADYVEDWWDNTQVQGLDDCANDLGFPWWAASHGGMSDNFPTYWFTLLDHDPDLLPASCTTTAILNVMERVSGAYTCTFPLDVALCASGIGYYGLNATGFPDYGVGNFLAHYTRALRRLGNNMPNACRSDEFYNWLEQYQEYGASVCAPRELTTSVNPISVDACMMGDPDADCEQTLGDPSAPLSLVESQACAERIGWTQPVSTLQDAANLTGYLLLSLPWLENNLPDECVGTLAATISANGADTWSYLQGLIARGRETLSFCSQPIQFVIPQETEQTSEGDSGSGGCVKPPQPNHPSCAWYQDLCQWYCFD